ncbi:hypothetical protein TBLA_0C02990 [Henningerozyma blattae CBS 6284]|uniref:Uncharacterized protein n=1 Tax=Henningerozyma blattae (strain ATCC 34711 / CBS 6284 / DSM 70876 / NBRC 10599 / NRRL Y-10934 / UCD 77-7) TaxID=1071380 RepID=I2H151_HENB6|nr:hypothetical protein TBLA_0C02990 [Tetrapisispora blattae CBS 6284]CCH60103.1 hypothetical protein TBLA_0C02990 [Tetrapisispora blattae CBS 6284]
MSKGQLDPLNLDWVVRSPTQVVNPTDIYSPLSSKQLDYSLRNSQQEAHHHHHNHQHRIRSESSSSSEIAMSPSLSESEMSPLSPLGDSSRNSSTDSKVFRINSIQPLRNSQSFKISRESSKNQSNEKLSSSYTDKNDIEKSRRSNNIIQNFPPDPQKTIRRTKSTSEVLKNLQNPSSNSITSTNNYGSPPSNSGHHLFRTRKTLNDLQPISRINNATKEKSKEKEPRLSSGGFLKVFLEELILLQRVM